jgi:hypothetical protein
VLCAFDWPSKPSDRARRRQNTEAPTYAGDVLMQDKTAGGTCGTTSWRHTPSLPWRKTTPLCIRAIPSHAGTIPLRAGTIPIRSRIILRQRRIIPRHAQIVLFQARTAQLHAAPSPLDSKTIPHPAKPRKLHPRGAESSFSAQNDRFAPADMRNPPVCGRRESSIRKQPSARTRRQPLLFITNKKLEENGDMWDIKLLRQPTRPLCASNCSAPETHTLRTTPQRTTSQAMSRFGHCWEFSHGYSFVHGQRRKKRRSGRIGAA